jgi:hypothetical protein
MRKKSFNKKEIISKIQSVEALFKKASEKIKNEKIRLKMNEISSINENFVNMMDNGEVKSHHHNGNGKITSKDDSSRIDYLNQKELLRLCLQKEEELVKLYQKAISYYQLSKPEDSLYKNQLYKSLTHFNQMKMAEEALHYQN